MTLILENDYLPRKYNLALEIDGSKPNFQGTLVIPLERVRNETKGFKLILNGFKLVVLKAYVGKEQLNISYDRDSQRIVLMSDNEFENTVDCTIEYMGTILSMEKVTQTRGIFKSLYNDKIIISTQTQPIFSRQIMPLIDEANFKVSFQLSIKTLGKFQVVSNTSVKSVEEEGENKVWKFQESPPMLSSTFGFTLGDLDYAESSNCDVPVRIYGPKGDLHPTNTSYILSVMDKLFPLATSKFGAYPLSKLDIVGIPYLTEGAMENWGMITVSKDHLFKGHELHLKQLLSHELIHQWMGNLVSFENWRYLWLNESFATLIGNYFVTLLDGNDEAFKLELITINDRVVKDNISIWKFMNSLAIDKEMTTTYLFSHQAYEKGIVLLRMIINSLSETVDDFDHFLEIIKQFIEAYKFKSINVIELWSFLNDHSNIDFISLINIWIRYDKLPSLQINWEESELLIEQIQAKIFHFPLILKTTAGDQKTYITEKTTRVKVEGDLIVINKDKISLIKADISKKIIKNIDVENMNELDCNVYLNDYKVGDFNKRLSTRVNSNIG